MIFDCNLIGRGRGGDCRVVAVVVIVFVGGF